MAKDNGAFSNIQPGIGKPGSPESGHQGVDYSALRQVTRDPMNNSILEKPALIETEHNVRFIYALRSGFLQAPPRGDALAFG